MAGFAKGDVLSKVEKCLTELRKNPDLPEEAKCQGVWIGIVFHAGWLTLVSIGQRGLTGTSTP